MAIIAYADKLMALAEEAENLADWVEDSLYQLPAQVLDTRESSINLSITLPLGQRVERWLDLYGLELDPGPEALAAVRSLISGDLVARVVDMGDDHYEVVLFRVYESETVNLNSALIKGGWATKGVP